MKIPCLIFISELHRCWRLLSNNCRWLLYRDIPLSDLRAALVPMGQVQDTEPTGPTGQSLARCESKASTPFDELAISLATGPSGRFFPIRPKLIVNICKGIFFCCPFFDRERNFVDWSLKFSSNCIFC